MVVGRRVGRPAKCGVEGSVVTLTVRLPAGVKNWLVGEALKSLGEGRVSIDLGFTTIVGVVGTKQVVSNINRNSPP